MRSRPMCRIAATMTLIVLCSGHPILADDPPSAVAGQTSLGQLSLVGLPADRLLASGLTSPQIIAAAQRLRDASTDMQALDAALRELATAQEQLRDLSAAVATGGSTEATSQALATARASVQTTESQVATLRAELRSRVLADATPEQQALLERALSGAKIGIDGAIALAAANDAELRKVAVALQAESRSQRLGEALAPRYQLLLSNARAQPQVAAAATRIDGEWASLRQALSAPSQGGQP